MLNFWDMSGHPEFYEIRNEFYRDVNAILLVFDLTIKGSLDGLDTWVKEANEFGAGNAAFVIIGNKVINFF